MLPTTTAPACIVIIIIVGTNTCMWCLVFRHVQCHHHCRCHHHHRCRCHHHETCIRRWWIAADCPLMSSVWCLGCWPSMAFRLFCTCWWSWFFWSQSRYWRKDDDSHLTTVLMVDGVPVTHWRRLVLSHVGLRYVEPGHHYQGQFIWVSRRNIGIKYFVLF